MKTLKLLIKTSFSNKINDKSLMAYIRHWMESLYILITRFSVRAKFGRSVIQ